MKIKFHEINEHWWQSECTRYSVAIVHSPHCVKPFTAFHGHSGLTDKDGCSLMPDNLGAFETRREAFAACLRHQRTQPRVAA
jgi:hypothetical protein